jgi:hypothetical protein
MGLKEMKKLLHNKKAASKLKRSPTKWEKVFELYIRQGTDNNNMQGAQKIPSKSVT